jgi:hypothetical protein
VVGAYLQGETVELTYELYSIDSALAGNVAGKKAHTRLVHGADGNHASITIKFKPFVFAVDDNEGKCMPVERQSACVYVRSRPRKICLDTYSGHICCLYISFIGLYWL